MTAEKAATATAFRQILELLSDGRSVSRMSRSQRKALMTRDAMKALTRNPKELDKVVRAVLEISDDFLTKTRMRRESRKLLSMADERALRTRVTGRNSQVEPFLPKRNDQRVYNAKAAATEDANKIAKTKSELDSLSKAQKSAHLEAFNRLYDFGQARDVSAKLGYFLGRRSIGASAKAAEIAWAKQAFAAREMLMAEFRSAALGQQANFLKNLSERVAEVAKAARSEAAALSAAKELLRDEFAIMRSDALDVVLENPKLTKMMEDLGFTVKRWKDVKHLSNAKYLPRLFFEVKLGGKTVRIGFDIDHADIGFAESRTAFVEKLLGSRGKIDPELLRPIFDPSNFTLETARHNRNFLEGVRAEAGRYEAAREAAQESLSSVSRKAAVSDVRAAARESVKTLESLGEASEGVKRMMAALSTFEDSPDKRELMDSLAELSSILGDTL